MRKALIQTLVTLAEQDDRIVLLTADLGFMVVEPFKDRFPDRFFNVGVMEQNMIGVATGLALNGFIPFVYSIATFAALRSYEFIRNGPMAHNLPVRIIGIGNGVEYGHDGLTHHALEDIAVMRTLPSLSIISPADKVQADKAIRSTWNLPGPVYYRISKFGDETIPNLSFSYRDVDLIKQGQDAILFVYGPLSYKVLHATQILEQRGLSCAVVVISTLQPINITQLRFLLCGYAHAFTFEAHYATGGIGTILAEVIAEHSLRCTLHVTGLVFTPGQLLGSQSYLEEQSGLSVEKMVEKISRTLKTEQNKGIIL